MNKSKRLSRTFKDASSGVFYQEKEYNSLKGKIECFIIIAFPN